jgi:hypothetical protein
MLVEHPLLELRAWEVHGLGLRHHPPAPLAMLRSKPNLVMLSSDLTSELTVKAVNTVRVLSADMVQKANSGHPG